MLLVKPVPYKHDPGHSLPPEEFEKAAKEATPIDRIKSRSCWRESTNDRYRLGRK